MCKDYRFTELLLCIATKEHLLILNALAPFTLPAQHRWLFLAEYIQQYNVGGGKEIVHRHRRQLFKPTSFSLFIDDTCMYHSTFWTKKKSPWKRTTVNCSSDAQIASLISRAQSATLWLQTDLEFGRAGIRHNVSGRKGDWFGVLSLNVLSDVESKTVWVFLWISKVLESSEGECFMPNQG